MPTEAPRTFAAIPMPRRAVALSATVVAVALAVAVGGLLLPGSHPDGVALSPAARLGVAAALMAVAQLARLRIRVGTGTVNVAWGEAALIAGLYLVPAGGLPAAVFAGTGVAVVLISLLSDRRSPGEILRIAASLTVAAGAGAALTSAIADPYGAALTPGLAVALIVGSAAYLTVTTLLVALTLALRHGLPFPTLVLRTLHGKLIMFVGNVVVGLVVVAFVHRDARWLVLLPPALWLLQQTYAHRLRAESERRAWLGLVDATQALNQLDEQEVARAGARGAVRLFGAELVEVDVFRPDGQRRRYRAEAGLPPSYGTAGPVVRQRTGPGTGPGSGPGARTGRSWSSEPRPPVATEWDAGGPPPVDQSGRVVLRPMRVGGADVGELRVRYPAEASPGQRDELALTAFSVALGAALHDAATHRRLRLLEARSSHDKLHDPLTGLLNRAALLVKGDVHLRLLESDRPVALLLLDVDHFKEVNDTLGHAAGDELLQVTARRLGELTQPGELLARLGGDEYAILLSPGPPPGEPAGLVDRPAPMSLVLRRA
ncbi:MAG TPA: GGDEF domain-containing protein, partial [Pilimelia sp.]|nr:GGDEF domain-containing protein [Pilimelia sp.]